MSQGFQILIVDDETIVRRAIQMLLEHDGHMVWQADDGEAALKELAQRRFDLVITDFSMPGMHGDELVVRIRQMMPTLPIIMATAFVAEYKVFGQLSGTGRVDALLIKPFTFKQLREAIEKVTAKPGIEQGSLPIALPSATAKCIPPEP